MATQREEILKMVKEDKLSIDEALILLGKTDDTAQAHKEEEQERIILPKYEDMLNKLIDNTIEDLERIGDDGESELDKIEKIAKMMKMESVYKASNGALVSISATRDILIRIARENVKCALQNLMNNAANSEAPENEEGICETGRFEAHAWFVDGCIEITLKFVPFTAFGCSSDCAIVPEIMLEKYRKDINVF